VSAEADDIRRAQDVAATALAPLGAGTTAADTLDVGWAEVMDPQKKGIVAPAGRRDH